MSEPFVANGNHSKSLLQRPLVWGIVILALLFGAFFILFNNYRGNAGQPPLVSQAALIVISQPTDGEETMLLGPLSVSATAAGPTPFLSMELWINGELMGVQAAPSEGKHPFSASFSWIPTEPGVFSLIARAVDKNNQTNTSSAVKVFVSSKEEGDGALSAELVDEPTVSPAAPGGYYSPPTPPNGGSSIEPAEEWNGSPGDWVNSLSNDAPPIAPELTVEQAEMDGCFTNLNVHDLSDNETGFAVYRQATNDPNFVKIATLASNSQSEWIYYTDQNDGGGVTYYVSSFNAEGASESNLAVINIDPNECPPEPSDQIIPVLAVQFEALKLINTSPDMVYCYRSLNGGVWSRWPFSGFFYPDDEGAFGEDEVIQLALADIDGNTTAESFVLKLNCWGWYGAMLDFLGSFELMNDDLSPGGFSQVGEVLTIGGVYTLEGEFGPTYALGGDVGPAFVVDPADKLFTNMVPPEMIRFEPKVTYDPDLCTSHLMPDARNLLGTILFCFPYPGFHGGLAEGDNPQPYLIWDETKFCPAGYGTGAGDDCKSYAYYLQQANANDGTVGFTIYDNSGAGNVEWTFTAPYLQNLTIPANGCKGGRSFFVQMWYRQDNITQTGPVSTDATINCPKPVGNVVLLDFIFESIQFNNIDDGESDPEDVEVFGHFQVMAPSSPLGNNNYLKIGTWDEQASNCPDDTDAFFSSSPPPGCPQLFETGTYSLYNVPLCKSSDFKQSNKFQCFSQITPNYSVGDLFQTNNNRLRVEVQDGDGIKLAVIMHDWDDASANDLVCYGPNNDFASSKTVFQWHAIGSQSFTIFGFYGSDGMTCIVKGVMNVVE